MLKWRLSRLVLSPTGYFLSLVKESDPPETCPAKRKIPPDYKGAHKTVILKITIMASVRRDWQRNNGYLVRAGYLLFFCRREKQWIYSQLSAIMFLNQSYPIHSEIFSKNLKKV